MITKTKAIANFLNDFSIKDLATLYHHDMECQINVAKDMGEPIASEYHGKKWRAWTDGNETWKSFRIPYNAATSPTYDDTNMSYDLSKHVEAIGMTGWNWKELSSRWVAFDFDSIANHEKGLTDEQLKEILDKVKNIPWVQVRYSSSGKGYHIYVYLDPYINTQNHHEHAALARSILSKISAETCFDFRAKVDICGGNIWVWHRKMKGTNGFQIIKDNTSKLSDIPPNWKDHVKVIKGNVRRIAPDFIDKEKEDSFDQLCGQYLKIELDSEHKKLVEYLQKQTSGTYWWDSERHMLITHTYMLLQAHNDLSLKGIFQTNSKGNDLATQNCFCQPLRNGGWIVRRFSPGCSEAETWNQDKSGWTRCFLNREPDFETAARAKGGVDLGDGKGYQFREAEVAVKAAQLLGVNTNVPTFAATREAIIKQQKDGKIVIEIDKYNDDSNKAMEGWAAVKGKWRRIFNVKTNDTYEVDVPVCDDIIRHTISEIERSNIGWYIKSDQFWNKEPIDHVRPFLKSQGYATSMIEPIIGLCVNRSWREVNKPFEDEYVGNREWNKRGAKLRFTPSPNLEGLKYPSWNKILNHIGKNLDSAMKNNEWAVSNSILTGADYLKCWISSLFQFPYQPLPYLFLFGPQDCGKSILHEALGLLFDRGHVQANQALLNNTGFNGELANAVLCYVEEIDLSKSKLAYNRIKDWCTSRNITIREMQRNAYQLPNCSHWVQCSNSVTDCPAFSGDTRITMIEVEELDVTQVIPKHKFIKMLSEEASDFLASLLRLELPEPISRLNIPVITTMQKLNVENQNLPIINQFIKERCFDAPGELSLYSDVYEAFIQWLPKELHHEWPKITFSRQFPTKYPRGPHTANITYVGNISLTKPEIVPGKIKKPWTLDPKGRLVNED